MVRIDAHIHINGDHEDCIALLERLDLKLFNVCVAHTGEEWRVWRKACQALAAQYPQRYAWCTTFDVPDFSDEVVRKRYENDHWSPWPEDAGPGQPPPSILGMLGPGQKGLELAHEVWREIGYCDEQ